MRKRAWQWLTLTVIGAFCSCVNAPLPAGQSEDDSSFLAQDFQKKDKGPGGKGGPGGGRTKLIPKFDKNGDGRLNTEERKSAREWIAHTNGGAGGKGGPGGKKGGKGGFGGGGAGTPGPKVVPADVKNYADAHLYDTKVLRTIFIDFENKKDWEAELSDFYHTDVEVPATITVDGKKYSEVGIHFHGNSSYFGVSAGLKRSLHLSFDYLDDKQRLYNYKTLSLLNAHDDPTCMHTVLFCNISRTYTPTPRANFVKVVINGESWGVYASQQQFNKDFLKENYGSPKGARWHVRGSPGSSGAGLEYLGDNTASYKNRYQIKSKDDEKDWQALALLCKTLNQTPLDKLEDALKPMLDIEGVLWFLALDNMSVNDDGYWTRASDYNICRDEKGIFHVVAYDVNETFGGGKGKGPKGGGGPGDKKDFDKKGKKDFDKKGKKGGDFKDFQDFKGKDFKDFGQPGQPGGKGGKGGPGGGGFNLDPLSGLTDSRMPLRSKLLNVPSLRTKYLQNMRTIAQDWLEWKKLKPVIEQYRVLIEKEVEIDTRKLYSFAAFKDAVSDTGSYKNFADQRGNYLLNYPAIKQLPPRAGGAAK